MAILTIAYAHTSDDFVALAKTYGRVGGMDRTPMTGEMLKTILEDVCDNLFNVDPYYQQGSDMVRVGGMSFTIHVDKAMGHRIQDIVHLKSGQPIAANTDYVVAGWASVNEGTQGPPIWDVIGTYLKQQKTIAVPARETVKLVRG